jgi:hypothetical protein
VKSSGYTGIACCHAQMNQALHTGNMVPHVQQHNIVRNPSCAETVAELSKNSHLKRKFEIIYNGVRAVSPADLCNG